MQGGNEKKEPFDYEDFVKFYLHDRGSCRKLTGQEPDFVRAQYKRDYDDHPDIKTVRDYAHYLDEIEANGSD